MKRTAFLQAFLIFVLLGISWVVLVFHLRSPEVSPNLKKTPSGKEEVPPAYNNPLEESRDPAAEETAVPVVPPVWREWTDYLRAQGNPGEMRRALGELQNLLLSMPADEAINWIMAFVDSRADLATGLAFQPKKNGDLLAASSLRAYLLDLLSQLDPALAADIAWTELATFGTGLDPDVYVIHMRNAARSPTSGQGNLYPFLTEKLEAMLDYRPWVEHPGSAIAEAMDILVYLESVEFVPRLTALMEKGRPEMLRHASALALERLVDRRPRETLQILLRDLPESPEPDPARAGYFARLDPDAPASKTLLEDYLKSPILDYEEAVYFLQSFPNLNRSLSYNLLSTNISNTPPGDYMNRLRDSLKLVQAWEADPELDFLKEILTGVESRINSQITGDPLP